jgi:hypothetical protein
MSVSASVAGWEKYMTPFVGKAKLVSPAVTNVRLSRSNFPFHVVLTLYHVDREERRWVSPISALSPLPVRSAGRKLTQSLFTGYAPVCSFPRSLHFMTPSFAVRLGIEHGLLLRSFSFASVPFSRSYHPDVAELPHGSLCDAEEADLVDRIRRFGYRR